MDPSSNRRTRGKSPRRRPQSSMNNPYTLGQPVPQTAQPGLSMQRSQQMQPTSSGNIHQKAPTLQGSGPVKKDL